MTPENTQKLYETFPRLYRGRNKSPQESSMCWGFSCDDGWFDLIWNLSQAIEDAARREGIEPQSDDWPEARQVKEKVGTLRFYLAKYTEANIALIDEAVDASAWICEVCGSSGSSDANSRNGIKTVCSDHAKEFIRKISPNLLTFENQQRD